MAEKKTTKKTEKKATPKTYKHNGVAYKIIDETEQSYKLTDGIIHFWARKKDERN